MGRTTHAYYPVENWAALVKWWLEILLQGPWLHQLLIVARFPASTRHDFLHVE